MKLLEASKLCKQFIRELIVIKADIRDLLNCDGILQEISRGGTSEEVSIKIQLL